MQTWQLICADTTYNLTTQGNAGRFNLLLSTKGHFGGPVKFISDQVPYLIGEELRDQLFPPNEVIMPLAIMGSSSADVLRSIHALRRSLDPRADVQIKVTNDLGETRILTCRYESGFENAVDDEHRGPNMIKIPLKFMAFDPLWYGDDNVVFDMSMELPTQKFFSSEGVAWFTEPGGMVGGWRIENFGLTDRGQTLDIYNPGDVDAYPIWAVKGPGSQPSFQNITTGNSLRIDYSLDDGEVMTIDTREGHRTISSSNGTNLRPYLDDAWRSLWTLAPGNNEIIIDLALPINQSLFSLGATEITMTATPAYWGI